MEISPELYQTIVSVVDARMAEIRVLREDFDALTSAVRQLAEAQAQSEERLTRVEAAVERLAEAQARTEERLTRVEAAVERLAEAQAQSEERLTRVEAAVERLAEAQARSEERLTRVEAAVERLAEAQARSEERLTRVEAAVERLAEAQRRTEEAVRRLSEGMDALRQQVGRLSEVIGMGLEDIARITLPGYLERHLGVRLAGELGEELTRWIVGPEGRELEFDLYGEGQRDGRPVTVVGETKSRIYSDDVRRFLTRVRQVEHLLAGEVIRVMFGYAIHPVATQLGREQGVVLVASYQR